MNEQIALPSGASVVVVGAGVTGLSAAWWLARSGVDVVVLDKGVVGWEASGRNGGGCSHYQSPLFLEEQRLWPQMDALLGYPTEYRRERIILAVTDRQWAQYRRIAEIIRQHGIRVDELDPQACREAIPLAGDNAVGAIHVHGGGHANPQRTVQAYAWALQDLGGRILQHCPAQRIVLRGGKAAGVETPRGFIACDHVVVAAGPQSEALLAPAGIRLPLASARAEMIVTEPLPLMRIGGCDGNGLYGRQTLRGNLAYGGGPHEWLDVEPDGPFARPSSPLLANLSRRLADLFPKAAHVRVIRSWAGIIENTPDGRPVIDRPADPGNVTVCTMSGVGFGLSPASGHAIRDLVLDGRCSFTDIEKLGLHRFRNLAPDWRERQGWLTPTAAAAA
ncbi:NAD(P)/FAD-dependent oxidoreductase [Methylobacterium organophilum]|uniref:Sarcosine oxidase subunit beta n=1 Tax=Methylobacterium organophilum TaxID=410 RepID=A0ABQ4TAH8_METOR|nr:FAD-binding oxidoreductase [Methylobacterium organophilum]UMY16757.1 FAD-binding oxidoreductase [Methylobacterium organophilum]GJE27604.1 Sarcosine oxidase subunit beta [Methylobacterium organophilum]